MNQSICFQVFVNMINSKLGVYSTKLDELIKTVESRMKRRINAAGPASPCFFSYTWVNSHQAVKAGTRLLSIPVIAGSNNELWQSVSGVINPSHRRIE